MSDKAANTVLDELCDVVPGCLCAAIYDMDSKALLVQRLPKSVRDDGTFDTAVAGAARAFGRLEDALMTLGEGAPSRVTCETGGRHVAALRVGDHFLAVVVAEEGQSGLTGALLDVRGQAITGALAALG